MSRSFSLTSLAALLFVAALSTACDAGDETTSGESNAPTNELASASDAEDASDTDGGADGDDTEGAEDGNDEAEVAANLCTALPVEAVMQLFADTTGETIEPLAIATDEAEKCRLEENSVNASAVSLDISDELPSSLCQTQLGDDPVDGIGDLACWNATRNANELGLNFVRGDIGYTVIVSTNDFAFDGEFYEGRSEEGVALVEGVALLATNNLD